VTPSSEMKAELMILRIAVLLLCRL
jgi:hypothetical protein